MESPTLTNVNQVHALTSATSNLIEGGSFYLTNFIQAKLKDMLTARKKQEIYLDYGSLTIKIQELNGAYYISEDRFSESLFSNIQGISSIHSYGPWLARFLAEPTA